MMPQGLCHKASWPRPGVSNMASIGKSLQVLFPVGILLFSQLVEVIPTENTGAMLVVKLQA